MQRTDTTTSDKKSEPKQLNRAVFASAQEITRSPQPTPPTPAGDAKASSGQPNWFETKTAIDLLDSISETPPKITRTKGYNTHNRGKIEHIHFNDARVTQLELIRNGAGKVALAASDEGDKDAFANWCDGPTIVYLVNEAILRGVEA